MKSLFSWILAIFMIMFWVFRLIVSFMAQYGNDFAGFIAFNYTIEIVLLFTTILCFVLFLKRNIVGGILYLGTYGFYFSSYILTNVISGEISDFTIMQNVMIAAIGLVIAMLVFFDLIIDKSRKKDPKDQKTDWYFKNDKYDRQYDERADKNQYRNY